MDRIATTLNNFSFIGELMELLPLTKGFELTKSGVIRALRKPLCPQCGQCCKRNGWDTLTRKDLVTIKVGKFRCVPCDLSIQSDLSFWERLIIEWEETIAQFFLRLADRDVALRVISTLMDFLVPMSKDSILRRIVGAISRLVLSEVSTKYQIVHYDEQHPKKGRQQQYRLTLISAVDQKVIADELHEEKSYATVYEFLTTHLDPDKETIIITDDCPWYPTVFEDIWGEKVRHQLCILHLNKLIIDDCGRAKSLQDMHNTYLLLNIFFNRSRELQFLKMLLEEQHQAPQTQEWLKKARKRFNQFVRNLEKMRRRENRNLQLRTLEDAKEIFVRLQQERQLLPKPLRKRLDYIRDHWEQFTLFYEVDCPHTNNIIENYFSASLKTHRKKQFRTEKGLTNKLKLSRYKRNEGFMQPIRTFLQWGKIFCLVGT